MEAPQRWLQLDNSEKIIVWFVNTVAMTASLTPQRQLLAIDLLTTMFSFHHASVQEWHKLMGDLRSMYLSIPVSRGCLSLLQHALNPGSQHITINAPIKDQLKDFLRLAQDDENRPTHIGGGGVVPTPPTYYGAANAAKSVMGWMWFPPGKSESLEIWTSVDRRLQAPCLWR